MERQLVAKVDRVIAVSETLQERMKSLGRTAELLTHGVDLEFWARPDSPFSREGSAATRASAPRARVAAPPPPLHGDAPLLLFWGVTDRRMDTRIVRALTEVGRVVLVGPQNEPDPELHAMPNVELLPAQPIEALPALAQQAAVLIMPYADLPVTRAM